MSQVTITIGQETEGENHWSYDVFVVDGDVRHAYTVKLGWSDYDLWSHGRVSPETVVRAAFEFLLQRESATSILRRFDCSRIRRTYPDIDAQLPKMI